MRNPFRTTVQRSWNCDSTVQCKWIWYWFQSGANSTFHHVETIVQSNSPVASTLDSKWCERISHPSAARGQTGNSSARSRFGSARLHSGPEDEAVLVPDQRPRAASTTLRPRPFGRKRKSKGGVWMCGGGGGGGNVSFSQSAESYRGSICEIVGWVLGGVQFGVLI